MNIGKSTGKDNEEQCEVLRKAEKASSFLPASI